MAHRDGEVSDATLEGVDIGALLEAALDKPPPADLADRVMSRLALVETVTEFARLLGAVPMEAASETAAMVFEPDPEAEEGEDDDG